MEVRAALGSREDPAFVFCINLYRRKAAVVQRDFHWDAAERHRQTSRQPVTDQRVAETDVDRGQLGLFYTCFKI